MRLTLFEIRTEQTNLNVPLANEFRTPTTLGKINKPEQKCLFFFFKMNEENNSNLKLYSDKVEGHAFISRIFKMQIVLTSLTSGEKMKEKLLFKFLQAKIV